ncbi:SDR family oxidoreductase [Beggiatoa leptomitoformis]|uniref:SDR family oxidoreductase n=1 Tax=Beggiatoa leptomitoformis TaxID=288004 RepID=A0A2N9YBN5_9GAMM|nr:SDR family oxidoreductase [Beggiatoa leptomitoformis]ALG66792.1 SDR family oxidoreductase [Beggiatoa leptomitoformis]AUI67861.1 SDR family oxidoreductase [Beggiatoa leptomitoformis]
MDFGIRHKVALVVGSSTGLGFSTAQVLLQEGVKVAICSRTQEKVDKAVSTLTAQATTDQQVYGMVADYTSPQQLDILLTNVQEKLGKIDILVCSSGGPIPGTATEFDSNDYAKAIENNLLAMIRLSALVLPNMQNRKWGRIVYITSSAAVQPLPNLALSNVARSGLHAYSKSLATEVAKDNITVNCVMPGRINTDRIMDLVRLRAEQHHRHLNEEMGRDFEAIPAGRYGQPRELANLVGFLCSDCASYITGSAIAVDGGAIAGLR